MAIMLSLSLRSPIKSYNMHIRLFMDQISITKLSTNPRTYKALNSNRNGHHVIIVFKTTHQVLQYAYPIMYGSNLNHTTFDQPNVPIRL